MATSKELLKAQANGATIEFVRGSVRTRRVVEYAPRGKGDQTPWAERVGQAIWRYSARDCVAFFPEPKVIQTPAAPVVEIRIPAEPKLIDIPFPAVTPAGQQIVEDSQSVPEVDRWLPRPDGAVGQQFRCRKTYKDPGRPAYRLGGQQFYEIVAETDEWVIWRAWKSDGSVHYEENADKRDGFEAEYERRPGL